MKFPQDWKNIKEDFRRIASNKEHQRDLKKALAWKINPWLFYKRIEPVRGEILCSFHNHTDGGNYELEDIARVGCLNGYRIMAITNHRRDYQFEGNRILYNKEFDVYLIRGMECRCEETQERKKIRKRFSFRKMSYKYEEEHGEENDLVLIGYEGNVRDFQPFEETIKVAKEQKAIIIMTAFGNKYARGPNQDKVLPFIEYFDAMEIFDSNHVSKLTGYEVVAKHFSEKYKIPGIYANDAHTLLEIGTAGIGFKEEDFPFLDNPSEVVNNPDILIETLRSSLKAGRFQNHGFHVPKLSFIYPSKLISLIRDAIIRPFDKNTGSWIYKE